MTMAAKPDAAEVGWLFVQQYYTFMNQSPDKLHLFYNKHSLCVHGVEGDTDSLVAEGQENIHAQISDRKFKDCKVLVSSVDSQASSSGGVVVQVLGEMSNAGLQCHKFCQTFFLAEQPSGYYVLNDIFRFLKEDVDADYDSKRADSPAKTTEKPQPQQQQPKVQKAQTTQAKPVPAAAPVAAPVAAPREQRSVEQRPVEQTPAPAKKAPEQPRDTSPAKNQAAAAKKSWAAAVHASSPVPAQATYGFAKREHSEQEAQSDSGELKPVSSRNSRQSSQTQSSPPDKEKYSIYLRNVNPDIIDKKSLHAVFSEVGQVRTVDMPTGNKHMAFVEFTTQEAALSAIGKSFTVNGETLLAEERRKPGGTGKSNRGQRHGGAVRGAKAGNTGRKHEKPTTSGA